MSRVQTNLATIRKARGMGAAELAKKVAVTRQTIYAIEAGAYLPNTEVTLRLARELEVAVEELFSLPGQRQKEPTGVTAEYLGRNQPGKGQAVRVCRVGAKWISLPVDAQPYQLPEADGVVLAGAPSRSRKPRLDLFLEEDTRRSKIVLAGCDPATGILARTLERVSGVEVVHAPASSQLALDWLREGKIHIAGSHLQDPDSEDFNLPLIRLQFAGRDMSVITFARWEEGLVVARGNPKAIRRIDDLARNSVTFVNREPGSGSRSLLDGLMRAAGLTSEAIRGYDHLMFGHLPAAQAVLTGQADCCIATRAAARTFGLDFVPLRGERYDFVLYRETLGLAAIEAFFDVLQRATLRRRLETLAGYDTSQTGVVRA